MSKNNNKKEVYFSLTLENIGNFEDFNFPKIKKNKTTLVFANNGSGKTTISRAFRLLEQKNLKILQEMTNEFCFKFNKEYGNYSSYDEKLYELKNKSYKNTNRNIHFEHDNGSVSFISNQSSKAQKVELVRDQLPIVTEDKICKFYVFNSDYVYKNLSRFNYDFDNSKYFLGEKNILNKKINKLKSDIQQIDDSFKKLVEKVREDLKKINIDIAKYIPAYGKDFAFSTIFKSVQEKPKETFFDLMLKYQNNQFIDNDKNKHEEQMCISMHFEMMENFAYAIEKRIGLSGDLFYNEKQIEMLELGVNKSDTLKFIRWFKKLLRMFFGNKYEFDKNEKCIKLRINNNSHKITETLSDGEKSIIAFCYYIADIYSRIDKKKYDEAFFIIDDPISSLDYNYVYHISSIISNIHVCFAGCSCLILTHNIDFYNMLTRNRIAKKCFTLKDKNIIESKDNTLVIPYFDHLKDIYIFKKNSQRRHTIANSMRYVLETLADFVYPHQTLQDLIKKLKNDKDFVRFIHDGSHGLFLKKGVSDKEQIIQYCDNIIDFISKELPEQHTWADEQADKYIEQLNAKEEKES